MPDKDACFRDDSEHVAIRAAYVNLIAKLLEVTGDSPQKAAHGADTVLAFETALAENALSFAELQELFVPFLPLQLPELQAMTPNLPWDAYLRGVGQPELFELLVSNPEFIQALDPLVADTSPDNLKLYLRWTLARSFAWYLTQDLRDAYFDFYGRTLAGREAISPRGETCASLARSVIPHDLGAIYIERYFPGDSQQTALSILENIEEVFDENLPGIDWTDSSTRLWAIQKLTSLENLVGFPDRWDDYQGLELFADNHFGNIVAARRYYNDRAWGAIGGIPDRRYWGWDVTTAQAVYSLSANAMHFPAGILQPPLFHRDYPDAVNYAGIGVIMGHELTHAFREQGSYFGPTGIRGSFWSAYTQRQFGRATLCLENLYSSYEVQPDLYVDGMFTLGENLADLGGLKFAHQAYLKVRGAEEPPELVEGLDDQQLFFVAAAHHLCSIQTDEATRRQVLTDSHAPERFRVIGPMSNYPPFADAFGCEEGSAMNPQDVCEVW